MSITRDGPHAAPIGVLWANLGTPAAPRPPEVRRYLRQFLTDRRVVDLNPILWRALLELVILPRRGRTSAHAYATVWTDEGSPLLANARKQSAALGRELGPDYRVATAMRYGEPSIAHAVSELLAAGCERLIFLPAFPQYASATTGSAVEELFRVLSSRRAIPAITVVPPYPADPTYLSALAAGARRATAGKAIDHWIFSFHGIPVRYARSGDPYPEQCTATAHGLAAQLGLADGDWTLTWQSRFGREPWLEPATDRYVIDRAPRTGTLAVVVPGFTADCLETLEEIGERLREDFLGAGGREFVLVPALNDEAEFVQGLAQLVRRSAGEP
ncbi:MAG: ferrochelatase [Planctomycetota bacterium]|nr:ferrochelatase [Planctomycetota bacterium]